MNKRHLDLAGVVNIIGLLEANSLQPPFKDENLMADPFQAENLMADPFQAENLMADPFQAENLGVNPFQEMLDFVSSRQEYMHYFRDPNITALFPIPFDYKEVAVAYSQDL
jgi:hypothetical protein